MRRFNGLLKIFGISSGAPRFPSYLSPWSFNEDEPRLIINGQRSKWQFQEKIQHDYVGVWKLVHQEQCLGFVATYTYIQPLGKGEKFLVWTRGGNRMTIMDTRALAPLEDKDFDAKALANRETPYLFKGERTEWNFQVDPAAEKNQTVFPPAFQCVEEILMVTDMDGLYEKPDPSWGRTALLVFKPQDQVILVYPQDWFNHNTATDFGYQWITRAGRDPRSGLIRLDGIRMAPQVLDRANRGVL